MKKCFQSTHHPSCMVWSWMLVHCGHECIGYIFLWKNASVQVHYPAYGKIQLLANFYFYFKNEIFFVSFLITKLGNFFFKTARFYSRFQ